MYLGEYEGYIFREEDRIKNKSSYNKNWYVGLNGEEIFAESDDDNHTEYYIAGIPFGESWFSEGGVVRVYNKFMGKGRYAPVLLEDNPIGFVSEINDTSVDMTIWRRCTDIEINGSGRVNAVFIHAANK